MPEDFDRYSVMSASTIRSKASVPSQRFQLEEAPKRKLLVIIEVNLGEEKGKHKIAVFEKDDPNKIADKFAEKY